MVILMIIYKTNILKRVSSNIASTLSAKYNECITAVS